MRLLFIFLFLIAAGCSTPREARFEDALKNKQCDQALESIPQHDPTLKFLGKVDRAAQTTLSYAATGAGYASDIFVRVVGTAVVSIVLCAPALVAGVVASSNDGGLHPACLGEIPPSSAFPQSGKKIYKATEQMRCPDLTALARSLRKVASCHEHLGGAENLAKAQSTLQSAADNTDFMECITKDERGGIMDDLTRVNLKASLN